MRKKVEVFWVHADEELQSAVLSEHIDILDSEERKTYERYLVDCKKVEFLIGRLLVKGLVGQKLGLSPKQIRFFANEYGKLFIDYRAMTETIKRPVFFNLSHSQQMWVCALSEIEQTGIDVEAAHQDCVLEVMPTVFLEKEIAAVEEQAAPEGKRKVFYRLWTRKEAVMKAKGMGFSLPPLSFSVPAFGDLVEDTGFSFYTFSPLKGYLASVAVAREGSAQITYEVSRIEMAELLTGTVSYSG
ncbi:4'-phosphopantetheinyl transferase superfamily protein [Brevibacillus ruminantium]|uniref:4'-phosphopantetheinyl transferase superfamily protein n=1 Tax=Brevibacillus ruminantium TaxID=2950604 RepID=A0ABY4WIS0_9BACL|nr:4'-phosphopantetheinyl transferase superfamily protein [Brevibacillus ruminantium]USG66599.1 4'-phosphopantetheinyl transferase superfamily protein [Brevibacillus ruminantium]